MVKLFAGGFPRDLEDIELKEIFEQFGTVEAVNIVRDKHTGISRRFGFVDMADEEGAASAIANLHEASVDDDTISVTVADERQKEKEEAKKQLAVQKAQMKAKPVRVNTQRPKGGRPFQKPYNNNRNGNSNGNGGYGRSNNSNYGGNNNYSNNHSRGNNNEGYRDYNNSSSYNNSTSGDVSYTKVVRSGEGGSSTGRRPRKRM